MSEQVYFHEFTFENCHGDKVTDLLIGTENAIARLMPHYKDADYKLTTLWQVTDIDQIKTVNYKRVQIIR